MKATKQKMDWAEEEEEDRERKVIKTVEAKKILEKEVTDANGKPATQKDIIVTRKTLVPVRRIVKDRKKWEKFGEVAGLPRGQHKPGDFARENEVTIQVSGEDQGGEIGIVAQLENITTAGMREKQLERKKKDLETNAQASSDTKPKGKSKLEELFSKTAYATGEISLRVNDIFPTDTSSIVHFWSIFS